MGDGQENWGQYLKRMTSRPGWSVARLARESGIHRATIFDWIREGSPPSVKLDSVRAIANALDDDLAGVLRVVGQAVPQEIDPELDRIRNSQLTNAAKQRLIARITERREREQANRLADLEDLIRAQERLER